MLYILDTEDWHRAIRPCRQQCLNQRKTIVKAVINGVRLLQPCRPYGNLGSSFCSYGAEIAVGLCAQNGARRVRFRASSYGIQNRAAVLSSLKTWLLVYPKLLSRGGGCSRVWRHSLPHQGFVHETPFNVSNAGLQSTAIEGDRPSTPRPSHGRLVLCLKLTYSRQKLLPFLLRRLCDVEAVMVSMGALCNIGCNLFLWGVCRTAC